MKFELILLVREVRKLIAAVRKKITNGGFRTGVALHWLIRFIFNFS